LPKLIGDNYEKLNKEDFIERLKVDKKFLSQYGDFGPIYGKQWRNWTSYLNYDVAKYQTKQIDQITNLIRDIKTDPNSRRLMVSAWNVGELDQMVLPPCHYGFQVYTRELTSQERKNLFDDFDIPERAISLMWNQRSVDTFLGLPFNITSYGLLLEILGKCVNMAPDLLIGNLGDIHLYSNHIEQAKEQISRDSFELPKLEINDESWNYLHTKNENADILIDSIKIQDFMILDYKCHPKIEGVLSN
jgi:thymidylate synthase